MDCLLSNDSTMENELDSISLLLLLPDDLGAVGETLWSSSSVPFTSGAT